MATPDAHAASSYEVHVSAPAGDLGIQLSNSLAGPTVDHLSPESPLQLDVGVGWKLLAVDDISVRSISANAAAELLISKQAFPRNITFLDPELQMLHEVGNAATPRCRHGEVVVEAPPGKLGLTLEMTHDADGIDCPTIVRIRTASPLAKRITVGWRLTQIDGIDVSKMSLKGVVKLLGNAAGRFRTLTFRIPRKSPLGMEWDRPHRVMWLALGACVLMLSLYYALRFGMHVDADAAAKGVAKRVRRFLNTTSVRNHRGGRRLIVRP